VILAGGLLLVGLLVLSGVQPFDRQLARLPSRVQPASVSAA
jgi:hypothetical protein